MSENSKKVRISKKNEKKKQNAKKKDTKTEACCVMF